MRSHIYGHGHRLAGVGLARLGVLASAACLLAACSSGEFPHLNQSVVHTSALQDLEITNPSGEALVLVRPPEADPWLYFERDHDPLVISANGSKHMTFLVITTVGESGLVLTEEGEVRFPVHYVRETQEPPYIEQQGVDATLYFRRGDGVPFEVQVSFYGCPLGAAWDDGPAPFGRHTIVAKPGLPDIPQRICPQKRA